jgi:rubredoxin
MDDIWLCPHCKKGKVVFVPALEPWHPDQMQCEHCDSTYVLDDDELQQKYTEPSEST